MTSRVNYGLLQAALCPSQFSASSCLDGHCSGHECPASLEWAHCYSLYWSDKLPSWRLFHQQSGWSHCNPALQARCVWLIAVVWDRRMTVKQPYFSLTWAASISWIQFEEEARRSRRSLPLVWMLHPNGPSDRQDSVETSKQVTKGNHLGPDSLQIVQRICFSSQKLTRQISSALPLYCIEVDLHSQATQLSCTSLLVVTDFAIALGGSGACVPNASRLWMSKLHHCLCSGHETVSLVWHCLCLQPCNSASAKQSFLGLPFWIQVSPVFNNSLLYNWSGKQICQIWTRRARCHFRQGPSQLRLQGSPSTNAMQLSAYRVSLESSPPPGNFCHNWSLNAHACAVAFVMVSTILSC